MNRRGFTLIELLVVIAIIAILAAILFPVFAQAKDAAKKTQSLSNQKQIATASLIYSGDHDDVFPMSAYFRAPDPGDPRPVVFSVYDAIEPYLKNKQIFVSPSDQQPGQDWKARLNALNLTIPAGGAQYASYIPNLGLFGENFCSAPVAALRKSTPTNSQSSLPDVVGTILFFDGYIRQRVGGNPAPLEYWTFMGMARHQEGLVINFADSHSKVHKFSGIPDGGNTPAGSRAPKYYSWRPTSVEPLRRTSGELESTAISPANPYNDLHGVPGTSITDSEDSPCP
jgi:prepilin-type N-terminal cleavage/methylation domain-containing protein